MFFVRLSFTDRPSDVAQQFLGDRLTYVCRFVAVNRGAQLLLIALKCQIFHNHLLVRYVNV